MTKIKSAIKLYSTEDSTMRLVRAFEENVVHQGHQSLVKEARKFAEELGFTLDLSFPHPKCRDNTDGADVPRDQEAPQKGCNWATENWSQGKEMTRKPPRSEMGGGPAEPAGCFAWLKNWDMAPTYTFAGMLELYEQLTPTKVYHARKTQTNHPNDILCRLCGKTVESIPHVLASCSALAQNKYLELHNAALKVLFWEMLRELQLSDTVPPWYSQVVPKPLCESPEAQARYVRRPRLAG